ncbi:spermatogenesis-associated protein 22-like isoform X2 [Myzus persicae]|uniref:spermatogenesis-associated protein 22-like isoform X2 n=1 Tax=Myzus persicae TaxID=13164 RepID=UPI000B9394E5|nr:spermatogenesis-associated protein 22-like isoform X2 [Myzus persicae]
MMDSAASGGPSSSKRHHPYERALEPSPMPASTLFTTNTAQNHCNKPNDESKAVIDEGKKLLVGSVQQVAQWCRMLSFLEPTKIIYQVFGVMDSVKTGSNKCEKIFCLRSEQKKSGIVCVFYEIDRKMPSISKGTFVLCTGHVKGKNKLQVFTIREILEDKNAFDRISLVSHWTINDILIYKV